MKYIKHKTSVKLEIAWNWFSNTFSNIILVCIWYFEDYHAEVGKMTLQNEENFIPGNYFTWYAGNLGI